MAADSKIPRPRVFISSTIADLGDLRDALKFWLEEMGYEVQISEHNDFDHRLEMGTFEACFESIREADYYVLIIGQNTGSWYDEESRITVTRQEYRTAYDSWQATRKPKLILFVRRDVMTILRERRTSGAGSDERSLLEDATFVADFVREVRRENEAREAVQGRGPPPAANWLAEFATFRELTDGLRSTLQIRGSLAKAAIVESLRHEMERNLRSMLTKTRGQPFSRHWLLGPVREDVPVDADSLHAQINLTSDQIKQLSMYLMLGTIPLHSFSQAALENAILSGAFLEFDAEQDTYAASTMLRALHELREALSVFEAQNASAIPDRRQWHELWQRVREDGLQEASVTGFDLIDVYALYDAQVNVMRLLVGILRHFYRHTADIEVTLRPATPIIGELERIEQERVTEAEMREWLEVDHFFLVAATVEAGASNEEQQATRDRLNALKQRFGRDDLERIMRRRYAYLPEEYVDMMIRRFLEEEPEQDVPSSAE